MISLPGASTSEGQWVSRYIPTHPPIPISHTCLFPSQTLTAHPSPRLVYPSIPSRKLYPNNVSTRPYSPFPFPFPSHPLLKQTPLTLPFPAPEGKERGRNSPSVLPPGIGPMVLSPYPNSGGIVKTLLSPIHMSNNPSSQPWMTCPLPTVKSRGVPRL